MLCFAYSIRDHDKPGMGADRHQLPKRAVRAWFSRFSDYDMRRHLRCPCKRHDNRRQPAQRDIFPCSLYGNPLFFPVQIRRTCKTDFFRTLSGHIRRKEVFNGVCTRPERLIQSQDKGCVQPYQTADCLSWGGSPCGIAAFLSAQRQRGDDGCSVRDDTCHVKNPNGLILGTPGSGKSFSAKREIVNAFLITTDTIYVSDPECEYAPVVNRLHGQVINLSPNSTQYINPMDINLNYSEDDNPLALKSDFLLSLCELVIGGKEGLQPVDKTVIDRAVRNVYRPFLADPDPAKMPILGDLYDELLKQPEPEAARIAAALELYVSGSLNVFNHRTNVELNNRLVCFDIKQLGKQLKKLGMLIVQDQVWNRVTVNRAAQKSTRYFMDEFHLLLKDEQTAAYSVEIWKRFRKWGGIPTAITQNVKDLLASREVENIFENSDFVLMLNQAAGDRAILAKQLNISPQQMSYVTHSEAGEGLLFYGNVILPFVDRFPKDTELYRVMTTKPEEVGGA